MNDIFVVTSEAWDGRRNERCVLAGDELTPARPTRSIIPTTTSSRSRLTDKWG